MTIKSTPAGEGLESSIVHAKSSVFDLLLLAGFCAYLFYFGLGYFGLIGADEPRYAQVAREMLARHDWIMPILGGTPWLEKPVLYYWQAMLAYSVFGVSDWASRLPSAIDATLMVVAVYFFLGNTTVPWLVALSVATGMRDFMFAVMKAVCDHRI